MLNYRYALLVTFLAAISLSPATSLHAREMVEGPTASAPGLSAPDNVELPSFCDATECGSLPPAPSEPGGTEIGTTDTCIKATSYKTCLSRCTCQYNGNYKKCKTSIPCKELAQAEKDACIGGCVADWAP